ncbi:MAG TPA: hypothetical protein VLF66_13105 [Thermoanaerobaculia bacterium]|nr:hypothetical protein [Thermoanaerobaculia bacterium]
MQRVCAVLIGIVLASGLATAAQAQTQGGEQELGFLATYFKPTKGGGDGFLVANARYGLFVTPAVQVGGGVGIGGPVDDLDNSLSVELFGAYYFSPESTNTFYARAGLFRQFTERDDFDFADAAFGYKSYLNERAAFFWEGGYGFAISSDVDGGVVRSVAGLTFLF